MLYAKNAIRSFKFKELLTGITNSSNMKTTKIHRKYTNWEYRAISLTTIIDEKQTNIIYGCHKESDHLPWTKTVELYRGPNFIRNSKDSNWSRCYNDLNSIPSKYLPYVDHLIETFNNTQFDESSNYINEN
jgi:hypothetical protein